MSVFADSSALVKRYADEAGADEVLAIGAPLVVSQLARVEVAAALWRKHRLGELAIEDASLLIAAFEFDWIGDAETPPRFAVVGVTTSICEQAAVFAGSYHLRAYDAVQLASSDAARGASPDCTSFAAFDLALRRAAAIEGFSLIPSVVAQP